MTKLEMMMGDFGKLTLEQKKQKVISMLSGLEDDLSKNMLTLIQENPNTFGEDTFVDIYQNIIGLALGIEGIKKKKEKTGLEIIHDKMKLMLAKETQERSQEQANLESVFDQI